jgi:hypothetical protein
METQQQCIDRLANKEDLSQHELQELAEASVEEIYRKGEFETSPSTVARLDTTTGQWRWDNKIGSTV